MAITGMGTTQGGPLVGDMPEPGGGGGTMPPVHAPVIAPPPQATYQTMATRPPYTGTPSSTHTPWVCVAPVPGQYGAFAYYGAV